MNRRKLPLRKNKGFSLIELLVTITIIAIIAIPLLRSFVSAMKLNAQAKVVQNGTQVAQDVAENFKAKTLESLLEKYKDIMTKTSYDVVEGAEIEGERYSRYLFSNIGDKSYLDDEETYNYIEGAGGERFFVNVLLDSKPAGGNLYAINEYEVPKMDSLYGDDVIAIYRQYSSMDSQLQTLFGNTLVTIEQTKKEATLSIECEYTATNEYKYNITLILDYTYKGETKTVSYDIASAIISEDKEIPNIYLIMPLFDKEANMSKIYNDSGKFIYYNDDKINITYDFIDKSINKLPEHEKDVDIYVVEQQVVADDGNEIHINKDNVVFWDKVKGVKGNIGDVVLPSTVSVYSNIYDLNDSITDGGEKNDYIYQMTVTVRYKEPDGDVLTSIVTTKER